MPIAHQPGSVPVEIPEQIPNPAVRPAAPPNPEPRPERKEPVKVPERVPASRVARDGFRHWSRPLQRAGSYDHRLSWLTNKKPGYRALSAYFLGGPHIRRASRVAGHVAHRAQE